MRSFALALSACAALLACGCAHAPRAGRGETVEAEGWTPYDAQRPLESRQRALAEAQKKAVERAVGVSVTARTRVDAAVTSEQRIEANVGGTIRRYDVLSERVEGGFLKVRIKALVSLEAPPPRRLDPASVTVCVQAGRDDLSGAVRAALTDKGFRLAEAAKADLVVTAEASGHEVVDARTAGFRSYRARVTLRGLARAGSQEFEGEGEVSGLDEGLEGARRSAEEQAAQAAAQALADKVVGGLRKE